MQNHETREGWLRAAATELAPLFAAAEMPLGDYRVGCGFPATGGLSKKHKTIGQCWCQTASADGTSEIFISPVLHDPLEVLATLAHELIHHAIGVKHGHGGAFKRAMSKIGLEGKPTATEPGEVFKANAEMILSELGDYPHAAFDPQTRKKQTTRLLLIECPECAAEENPYKLRVTAKALEDHGAPICPCHEISFEIPG